MTPPDWFMVDKECHWMKNRLIEEVCHNSYHYLFIIDLNLFHTMRLPFLVIRTGLNGQPIKTKTLTYINILCGS